MAETEVMAEVEAVVVAVGEEEDGTGAEDAEEVTEGNRIETIGIMMVEGGIPITYQRILLRIYRRSIGR